MERWNTANSSARSIRSEDAANRIFNGYADIRAEPSPRGFKITDPVFAMGSCFARELERELVELDGNVISRDTEALQHPAFADPTGNFRDGFFHRFTPASMLLEFQRCFDEIPWNDDSLLFEREGNYIDCHYWTIKGASLSRDATLHRRAVAKQLVRRVVDAKVIVITLGYTESWTHAGLSVNRPDPKLLARSQGDFLFRSLSYDDVISCLEGMLSLISKHHRDGDFQFFVTISPVPLSMTFTDRDIVTANMDSKATLRAAARAFADRHENVTYFPSYEMVMYSTPEKAWRPDRLHVCKDMVAYIMSRFVQTHLSQVR